MTQAHKIKLRNFTVEKLIKLSKSKFNRKKLILV